MKLHEIVGKPKLTEVLMQEHIAKIREKRNKTEWVPQLEIEKVLQRVFRLIPTNM
jgi:hypothetical protein